MALRTQFGASHLPRPNSKSVAGGCHWLGTSATAPVVTVIVPCSSLNMLVLANGQE
jgi:hypothetical protein